MTGIAEYSDHLQQEELSAITDALPALIAHVDRQERYVWNNRTYESWFDYASGDFSGRTIREVLGEPVYENLRKHIGAAFAGRKQIFRGVVRHKNLGDRIMQIYYIPRLDANREVDGLYILMADITEHRRTEQQVLRLLTTANEGVWELNAQRETVYVNTRMAEMLGYTPDEMQGRHSFEFFLTEDREKAEEAWERRMNGISETSEWRLRRKDGSVVWTTVSSCCIQDEQANTVGVLAMVTDITQRKLAEEEIRRLNSDLEKRVAERTAQLEAINRELEAFCYSVSHDLRAPLRAVRGFAEVLREQHASQLDARGQDFLRRTCEASSQMDKLINDLLRLSRVSRTEIQFTEVNLSELARSIAADLRQGEPSRQVEWEIAEGLRGLGDERLLRQVLENLLRNAWKFTSRSSPARIAFGEAPGQPQTFFVRDNGVGFDMDYAGKLFCVFQRLHSASDYPGSGVGLAIVQRIISRHGGRTWAEGRPGEGATFYFALPAPGAS